MKTLTTQVLNSDNSQMVLNPAEFRFDRVRISRNKAGDLVIYPRRVPRGGALPEQRPPVPNGRSSRYGHDPLQQELCA